MVCVTTSDGLVIYVSCYKTGAESLVDVDVENSVGHRQYSFVLSNEEAVKLAAHLLMQVYDNTTERARP